MSRSQYSSTAGTYFICHIVYTLVSITGNPDPARICTSHVERQNLTIRMMCRRFTRPTNAFSKKLASLKATLALHLAYYNSCRIHQTLRVTAAMAVGVTDRLWTLRDLLDSSNY